MHSIIIFITGAVTLSLELLSSRILTPYFGVSLYIWTGILSITLLSLAIGYYLGGKFANHFSENSDRLFGCYLFMPALSSLSLALSIILYPKLFFPLAEFNIVAGSFIACIILLFIPLVSTSAMNPILVAILSNTDESRKADSGAGYIFFVSTIGSAIGVLVTAFIFIPNITNYSTIIFLGIILSLIPPAAVYYSKPVISSTIKQVLIISAAGFLICFLLLIMKPAYPKYGKQYTHKNSTYTLIKDYASFFGNTKVIKKNTLINNTPVDQIIYYQDGLIQSITNNKGQSQTYYTYALEALSTGIKPDAKKALVLGLGAGILPMRFHNLGIKTDIVEINKDSINAAQKYFGYNPDLFTNLFIDARIYVKNCKNIYDIVIVDLFQGDTTPEHLLTQNFFKDVESCLTDDGVMTMNTIAITNQLQDLYTVIKTVQSVFTSVHYFHKPVKSDIIAPMNIFLTAIKQKELKTFNIEIDDVPQPIQPVLISILTNNQPIDQGLLARASILSDEYNFSPAILHRSQLAFRRNLISLFPKEFLLN